MERRDEEKRDGEERWRGEAEKTHMSIIPNFTQQLPQLDWNMP